MLSLGKWEYYGINIRYRIEFLWKLNEVIKHFTVLDV